MKKLFKHLIPFITAAIIAVSASPVWSAPIYGTPPIGATGDTGATGATGATGPAGATYDGTTVEDIISPDSGGILTLGTSTGNAENLTFDFDVNADQVIVRSSTGLDFMLFDGVVGEFRGDRNGSTSGLATTYTVPTGTGTGQQQGIEVRVTSQENTAGAGSIYGLHIARMLHSGTGTVGHFIGQKIASPTSTGGGAIGQYFQIWIDSPLAVSASSSAIHINGQIESGITFAGKTFADGDLAARIYAPDNGHLALATEGGLIVHQNDDTRAAIGRGLTIYSDDDTDANDYIHIQHDQTDGTISVGNGNLTVDTNVSVDGGTGSFGLIADGSTGGSLMLRDTDDAGWTECFALNGALSCTIDADGVPDGA